MKARAVACLLLLLMGSSSLETVDGWGFWAHQRINRIAVFTLPPQMIGFFKENIEYITQHAVDPDKRRYSDPNEAPRHYIDMDRYDTPPYQHIPHRWDSAVAKYSLDTLNAHGIVPWYIPLMMHKLTNAFKEKNKNLVLHYAADIGHYVADAHVPLHCTHNYNGQFTGQIGIHAFWESRVPELLGDKYDYFVGKAQFLDKPNEQIWKYVYKSAGEVDSVLGLERELNASFPADKKYSFDQRGGQMVRTYSPAYSVAYNKLLNNMAERKLREAVIDVGSIWYTCWVNAGSPDLHTMRDVPPTPEEKQEMEAMELKWRESSRMIGRQEE